MTELAQKQNELVLQKVLNMLPPVLAPWTTQEKVATIVNYLFEKHGYKLNIHAVAWVVIHASKAHHFNEEFNINTEYEDRKAEFDENYADYTVNELINLFIRDEYLDETQREKFMKFLIEQEIISDAPAAADVVIKNIRGSSLPLSGVKDLEDSNSDDVMIQVYLPILEQLKSSMALSNHDDDVPSKKSVAKANDTIAEMTTNSADDDEHDEDEDDDEELLSKQAFKAAAPGVMVPYVPPHRDALRDAHMRAQNGNGRRLKKFTTKTRKKRSTRNGNNKSRRLTKKPKRKTKSRKPKTKKKSRKRSRKTKANKRRKRTRTRRR